jgi:hypothetical protein
MGNLEHFEISFARVGWFIPPYIQMGVLSSLAAEIAAAPNNFTQFDLENFTQFDLESALAKIYEPIGLAAMVLHRYPVVPIVQDFACTIGEAIEAHFMGLDHLAVGGLIPVVEGIGRRLAAKRGLAVTRGTGVRIVFEVLAEDTKKLSRERNWGAPEEIESMMDNFRAFTRDFLFVDSELYPLDDKTNRHGIAHGAFSDTDYGRPLNFYKAITAVDFLTFMGSFGANVSWLAPSPSPDSLRRAAYYRALIALRALMTTKNAEGK